MSPSARTPSAALFLTFGAGARNALSVTTSATQDAVSKGAASNQTLLVPGWAFTVIVLTALKVTASALTDAVYLSVLMGI